MWLGDVAGIKRAQDDSVFFGIFWNGGGGWRWQRGIKKRMKPGFCNLVILKKQCFRVFLGSKSTICNLCFVIFKYDNYLVLIYLVKNSCNRSFVDDVTLTSSRN